MHGERTTPKHGNQNCELTLSELRQKVEEWDQGTYALKIRARKRFRDLDYRGYIEMAEVFMELYIASFRTKHPEGWFFKTHKWWEKHGLSRSVVDTTRKKLCKLGIVEERHWVGNRLEWRLIPAKAIETLYPEQGEALDQDFRLQQSSSLDCGTAANQIAAEQQSHKRESEKSKEKSVLHTLEDLISNEEATSLGDSLADALSNELEQRYKVPLLKKQRRRYKREFADFLSGHTPDEAMLQKVVQRIAVRWREYKLEVEEAWQDVMAGCSSPTAVPAMEVLKSHDRLGRYAYLAEQWDFTSEGQPPKQVFRELGGTDEERHRNLTSMRSVAQRAVRGGDEERRPRDSIATVGATAAGYRAEGY